MATEGVVGGRWGTREELLLAGAVLRYGIRDWDVVAAELRSRTLDPYSFTPEICKARYEDLQQRYSRCTYWFEELRKRRMEDLRQAIEQSEDFIGLLESMLETLKDERGDECHIGYGSSQTESPIPFQKLERLESSSKDGLSAGSFTHETQTNWPTESQISAAVPAGETVTKPEGSESCKQENLLGIEEMTIRERQEGVSVKKRRGKRKRKDCTRDCNRDLESGLDDLMGILHSVVGSGHGSIFQRRLDSQKRGRYKKMIRQHMDLDTLRLRITTHSISSAKEVYRDLLLLANNALVFYSKRTREHKSALLLRDLVMKMLQQHYKGSSKKTVSTNRSTMHNPPVKPRSARPGNLKRVGKGCLNLK